MRLRTPEALKQVLHILILAACASRVGRSLVMGLEQDPSVSIDNEQSII